MLRDLGSQAVVIDSAQATAAAVAGHFNLTPKLNTLPATFECYVTDSVEKFRLLGSQFLAQPIDKVQLLNLGG
jgi:glutamate racemase